MAVPGMCIGHPLGDCNISCLTEIILQRGDHVGRPQILYVSNMVRGRRDKRMLFVDQLVQRHRLTIWFVLTGYRGRMTYCY